VTYAEKKIIRERKDRKGGRKTCEEAEREDTGHAAFSCL